DRVLRPLHDLLRHRADDGLVRRDEVVAAHARGARLARGDHDDIRALGLLVAVRPGDPWLVPDHGGRLVQVQRLALRVVRDDVDEDDVRVVGAGDLLRARRADVAGTDDRDLCSQTRTPSLSMIASAYSDVPTAVGSSRRGFMS